MAITEKQQSDVAGVWVTITELARRKGVSKQSIAEKVSRLENEGRITTRREGNKRLVELASFDYAVGQIGDAFKELAAETGRDLRLADGQALAQSGLRDAQADRARYDAQLKALELAERQGLVVPLRSEHGLEAAVTKVSELLLRDLNAPMGWSSGLMEAASRGEGAVRQFLRQKIREQRETVSKTLLKLAGEATEAERVGFEIDLEDER